MLQVASTCTWSSTSLNSAGQPPCRWRSVSRSWPVWRVRRARQSAIRTHQDDVRPPGQKPDHLAVAARGGFDPHVVDRPTVRIDDRDVVSVGMRIDPRVHHPQPG